MHSSERPRIESQGRDRRLRAWPRALDLNRRFPGSTPAPAAACGTGTGSGETGLKNIKARPDPFDFDSFVGRSGKGESGVIHVKESPGNPCYGQNTL